MGSADLRKIIIDLVSCVLEPFFKMTDSKIISSKIVDKYKLLLGVATFPSQFAGTTQEPSRHIKAQPKIAIHMDKEKVFCGRFHG